MKNLLILTLTSLLFLGCGTEDEPAKDKTMKMSQLYTMNKGDKVIKTDENVSTIIKVHHIDGSKESIIELIEGNATIIRK